MAILQRRKRLVSFRVSDEEYEWLRSTSVAQGSRSISDFSRKAIKSALNLDRKAPEAESEQLRNLNQSISILIRNIERLSRLIDDIINRIDGDPGKS